LLCGVRFQPFVPSLRGKTDSIIIMLMSDALFSQGFNGITDDEALALAEKFKFAVNAGRAVTSTQERAYLGKNFSEHLGCEHASIGVVARAVVAAEQHNRI